MLPGIPVYYSSSVVWTVSVLPQVSGFFRFIGFDPSVIRLKSKSLGTVPSTQSTVAIAVALILDRFLSSV